MVITTPSAKDHERLAALASRYVDVASLPWVPTRFKGVDLKVLMEDKETGLMTALTRFAPGSSAGEEPGWSSGSASMSSRSPGSGA